MASNSEGSYISDLVKQEATMHASREELLVDASQTLVFGSVCQKGAGGRMKALTAGVAAGVDEVQTITPSVASAANEVHTVTPTVAANADCVQTITCGGTSTGGTMKIGVRELGNTKGGVRWTDTIAWHATEATMTASMQAALDDLLGANVIVVTEIPNTDTPVITLTFSGTGATNRVHGLVSVDVSAMTGCSTATVVMTTPGGGTITAGTYTISFVDAAGNTQVTYPIAWNANAAAINAALDDANGGVAGLVATGGPMSTPTAVVLTFSGTGFASVPQPSLVVVDTDNLDGCSDTQVVRTTPGAGAVNVTGSYRLGVVNENGDRQWTAAIAANANAAAISAALDDALAASDVVATGGPMSGPTAIVLTFSGTGFTGLAQQPVMVDLSLLDGCDDVSVVQTTAGGGGSAAVNEVQTATTTLTPDGGTFTLSVPHWNGTTVTTAAIAWNANAATIETAIDTAFALVSPAPEAGGISVSGTKIGDDDIVLTYDGTEYAGRDWPLATVDAALLLDGAVVCSSTFAETTKGGPYSAGAAAGICIATAGITTAGGVLTTQGLFLVRDAIVDVAELSFHSGNKVDAIEELKALGILCRTAAEIAATQTT